MSARAVGEVQQRR